MSGAALPQGRVGTMVGTLEAGNWKLDGQLPAGSSSWKLKGMEGVAVKWLVTGAGNWELETGFVDWRKAVFLM